MKYAWEYTPIYTKCFAIVNIVKLPFCISGIVYQDILEYSVIALLPLRPLIFGCYIGWYSVDRETAGKTWPEQLDCWRTG